jgi:hypothetical protein
MHQQDRLVKATSRFKNLAGQVEEACSRALDDFAVLNTDVLTPNERWLHGRRACLIRVAWSIAEEGTALTARHVKLQLELMEATLVQMRATLQRAEEFHKSIDEANRIREQVLASFANSSATADGARPPGTQLEQIRRLFDGLTASIDASATQERLLSGTMQLLTYSAIETVETRSDWYSRLLTLLRLPQEQAKGAAFDKILAELAESMLGPVLPMYRMIEGLSDWFDPVSAPTGPGGFQAQAEWAKLRSLLSPYYAWCLHELSALEHMKRSHEAFEQASSQSNYSTTAVAEPFEPTSQEAMEALAERMRRLCASDR